MAVQRESKRIPPKKSRGDLVSLEEEGVLETAEGVTHRGEVLELFENLIDYGSDEPSVAPKVKSNSTSSGTTNLEASLSVDDMLFDDSAKDGESVSLSHGCSPRRRAELHRERKQRNVS